MEDLLEIVELNHYDAAFEDWNPNEKHTLEVGQLLKITQHDDGSATIDIPRQGIKMELDVPG